MPIPDKTKPGPVKNDCANSADSPVKPMLKSESQTTLNNAPIIVNQNPYIHYSLFNYFNSTNSPSEKPYIAVP